MKRWRRRRGPPPSSALIGADRGQQLGVRRCAASGAGADDRAEHEGAGSMSSERPTRGRAYRGRLARRAPCPSRRHCYRQAGKHPGHDAAVADDQARRRGERVVAALSPALQAIGTRRRRSSRSPWSSRGPAGHDCAAVAVDEAGHLVGERRTGRPNSRLWLAAATVTGRRDVLDQRPGRARVVAVA